MKYTAKELTNGLGFAVTYRKANKEYYINDTLCDSIVQAKQQALKMQIQQHQIRMEKLWIQLEGISEKNHNDELKCMKTGDFFNMGDLLC
jgi:hypothetical protein